MKPVLQRPFGPIWGGGREDLKRHASPDDDRFMANLSIFQVLLVFFGGFVMVYIVLKSIGNGAAVTASGEITRRREREKRQRAEDAAAEAAGRAAAMEPLALNPDGSIEEPILAMVEGS